MTQNIELVQTMIDLTVKKQEALTYLCSLLAEDQAVHEMSYRKWYYNRKKRIENAILKVDIEFLELYNTLLERENVNSIAELPKEKFRLIKNLQEEIAKARVLEAEIKDGEAALMEEVGLHKMGNSAKHSKHPVPRAIDAYKKMKK